MSDYPSIRELARAIRHAREWAAVACTEEETEGYIDIRLQVVEGEGWELHTGDAQYDTDHRGSWGATTINPWARENTYEIARDLINQAREVW